MPDQVRHDDQNYGTFLNYDTASDGRGFTCLWQAWGDPPQTPVMQARRCGLGQSSEENIYCSLEWRPACINIGMSVSTLHRNQI